MMRYVLLAHHLVTGQTQLGWSDSAAWFNDVIRWAAHEQMITMVVLVDTNTLRRRHEHPMGLPVWAGARREDGKWHFVHHNNTNRGARHRTGA